jgi:hypothetical protein
MAAARPSRRRERGATGARDARPSRRRERGATGAGTLGLANPWSRGVKPVRYPQSALTLIQPRLRMSLITSAHSPDRSRRRIDTGWLLKTVAVNIRPGSR